MGERPGSRRWGWGWGWGWSLVMRGRRHGSLVWGTGMVTGARVWQAAAACKGTGEGTGGSFGGHRRGHRGVGTAGELSLSCMHAWHVQARYRAPQALSADSRHPLAPSCIPHSCRALMCAQPCPACGDLVPHHIAWPHCMRCHSQCIAAFAMPHIS